MFEITPWKPVKELSRFRQEMDKLWEDFFGRGELLPAEAETAWVPAIDVKETDDAVIVEAELPGMEPKDIDVSVSGDMLIIKGEKKREKEEKGENYYRMETRYGTFSRAIRIPVPVDQDKIEAKYDKGVLKITLPKKEESKAKQIEIK